jgi:hypothetical protein
MINDDLEIYNRDSFKKSGVLYTCEMGDGLSDLTKICKRIPLNGGGTKIGAVIHFTKEEHARQMFEKIRMGSITFGQAADCNSHRRD